MTDYDNTNRGSIWKNEDKREGKQDADFRGALNVDGVEYWVSAWKRKEGASPKAPALSFSIKPKEEKTISQRATDKIRRPDSTSTGRHRNEDMNDDVPFLMEWRG